MLKLRITFLMVLCVALTSVFILPGQAQDKDKKKEVYTGTAVMWREPTDIESRNLLAGAGGDAMKPDISSVTFIEQKTGGYSTKYRVRDAAGNEWIAKLGKEAQPDTAANRLLWAVGYETEVAYLVPSLNIIGKGTFENVRLEARPNDVKRTGEWRWADNPFKGKPELQGLKIMMALINNWDMKDSNNEILATKGQTTDGELRYIVSDLGGTFGKTGGFISRSRNKPSDYVKADFVKAVKGSLIDFNYGGKNKKLFEDLTVEDAKWIAGWLSRLSDDQIKDAFRAANYKPEEVESLARAVRERISGLTNISPSQTAERF
ncbi:MAG: hypothetical protein H7Z16_19860 [Pyrinomonadaceae bacterium]|nr:hypothetical protein [Pyrinomonadaceae bacterium]